MFRNASFLVVIPVTEKAGRRVCVQKRIVARVFRSSLKMAGLLVVFLRTLPESV